MQLTPHQQEAAALLHARLEAGDKEVSLSGPAGSGKTTMMKSFLAGLVDQCHDVAIVAPTNKAAKVLNDKGLFATTIHSQFFVLEEKRMAGSGPKFIPCHMMGGALPDGKRDHAEIIAVDESSMLNSWVLEHLRKMSDQLIMIGDPHQLPPVNDRDSPDGYFNNRRHDAELSEILRQAEGSPILDLATSIRTGARYDAQLRQFFPEENFADVAADLPQFIAFTNKERAKINRLVRARHGLTSALPFPDERLICTNNYDDIFMNGTECTLVNFKWNGHSRLAVAELEAGTGDRTIRRQVDVCMLTFFKDLQPGQRAQFDDLMVDWDRQIKNMSPKEQEMFIEGCHLRYGYCITAHAAQGSEYDSVVVIDQRSTLRYAGDQNKTAKMNGEVFCRRWLYTAITRARKELVIAPEWWANGAVVGVAA